MSKSMDIDYAILKTLQVHPDFKQEINEILNANCEKVNIKNFTSQYGARDRIKDYTPDDYIAYVAEKLIDIYVTGITLYQYLQGETKDQDFNRLFGEYYWPAKSIIDEFNRESINIIIYFKSYPAKLLEACSLVTKSRFIDPKLIRGQNLITLIDTSSYNNYKIGETTTSALKGKIPGDVKSAKLEAPPFRYQTTQELKQQIPNHVEQQNGVSNIQVRKRTVNKCLEAIIYGSQLMDANNEYSLNGLYATMNKGRRPNQEDAVLIMEHPKNPNFKIMAVSDGMGGLLNGEYASSETIRRISQWFESIPEESYYYPQELQKEFNKKIREISKQIYFEKNATEDDEEKLVSGATLVAAIITEKDTIVSSVGDSRAYTLTGKNLQLLTCDESQVWFKYQANNRRPTPQELDDDRFLTYNNVITRNIGSEELATIQTYMLPNSSYDRLLLFSDGVTDLLTQERLAVLSSGHDLSTITKYIVEEAITCDAIRKNGGDEYHRASIAHGKDNATAAMYARR